MLAMLTSPKGELFGPLLNLFARFFGSNLPGSNFFTSCSDNFSIFRFYPVFDVQSRIKDRLQLVVIVLAERFELVIVTLGALDGHSQHRRTDDLHCSFQ